MWQKATISAIANTLFRVHEFDPDRSVAIAFWFKRGKMVSKSWGSFQSRKILDDLTLEDAMKLLKDYENYKNSDKCSW
jgi:hypothetical protein